MVNEEAVKAAWVERFWAKVDKSGECWAWTAGCTSKGYGSFRVTGQGMQKAHRVAYELTAGEIPEGIQLDHICHNRACVNPDHLRFATNKQNQENRLGPAGRTASGVRGVYPLGRGRWFGRAVHHGEFFKVGPFSSIEETALAVSKKRAELFTHSDMDHLRARAVRERGEE